MINDYELGHKEYSVSELTSEINKYLSEKGVCTSVEDSSITSNVSVNFSNNISFDKKNIPLYSSKKFGYKRELTKQKRKNGIN